MVALVLAAGVVLLAGTGYDYRALRAPAALEPPGDAGRVKADLGRLKAENQKLQRELTRPVPSGPYIVIDQTNNRLYVKQGSETLHTAVCSAGSGMVLQEPQGKQRTWVFDTPRGRFKVLQKIEDRVWRKPDWAFVEEGQPLPKQADERIEYGVLGEYALYFGNGYMIHGTLYERLLGRSVTHGCIRLGREDLREVWRSAPIGTPIYIF